MSLLAVENLTTRFAGDTGTITAVDGISFALDRGETLAIVGESGCGKSTAALSLMRLVPVAAGAARLDGRDLLALGEHELLTVRGAEIGMVFQEPMTSLNPVLTIGEQITEVLHAHGTASRDAARKRAIELIGLVGIPDPHQRIDAYPHTLSGGMRQRAMIAMAIACSPKLLIADEPTTALDVTVQAQVLELLRDLKSRLAMGLLLITHDLAVVAELADRVAVMYAGRIVETAPAMRLFAQPLHPYTAGLLAASLAFGEEGAGALAGIPGQPPHLISLPVGCAFAPRCPRADARCRAETPLLLKHDPEKRVPVFGKDHAQDKEEGDRSVACHHALA
jgi:peptide/nickel transport system ATP-binding protein